MKELVDVSALGLNFPTSTINTTRSFLRRNENAVRKFIRGYVEGSHFAKTQRGFSRVATARPEQFIEARFFHELEKEGFIQRLWR